MGKAIELRRSPLLVEPKGCVTSHDAEVTTTTTTSCSSTQQQSSDVKVPLPSTPETPTTTTTSPQERPRRQVHFNKVTKSCIRTFRKDYDDTDYNSIWYSMEELNEIQTTNSKMIRKESRNFFVSPLLVADKKSRRRFCDTDDWSWRGFEYASAGYGMVKVRNDHVKTVLKFQKQQKTSTTTTTTRTTSNNNKSSSSSKALADHARMKSSSSGSILRARSHAIRDEIEASRIHKQETELKEIKPLDCQQSSQQSSQQQQQQQQQPRRPRRRQSRMKNYRRCKTF